MLHSAAALSLIMASLQLASDATATIAAPAPAAAKNFFMIAVDDLRPMFGDSYGVPEVFSPNLDKHFLRGGGSAMQHSYVQIAVCGPSRVSVLTGRRPDTTTAGIAGTVAGVGDLKPGWCWCQRGKCAADALFMTIPAWFAQSGYITAGNGKIFHPDACTKMRLPSFGANFSHLLGDDSRAWNTGVYGVEGRLQQPFDNSTDQFSEEQWGTIPGPQTGYWNGTQGLSWMKSPLADEQQTDGQLATHTVERIANFSRDGVGKPGGKPFFLATGFHKPHSPWIVPEKYFDLYDVDKISLAPNPRVPLGFQEENWHNNGNAEIEKYDNGANVPFNSSVFGFNKPVNNQTARELRHAYFAATSFLDAQVGRVMDALESDGYLDNTVVALWSDHGYHLGDTNSWCKETNFEKATRNTLFWRVPGQVAASQGRNNRFVEMVDFFPTVVELMGLPHIPTCTGVDQPPTVQCLQGDSYADEFVPALAASSDRKQNIFSQWPYPKRVSPGAKAMRMGYTVRTSDGFRLTQYVPYIIGDQRAGRGIWEDIDGHDDLELYDYTADPDETSNQAANPKHASVVQKLMAVLKEKYDPTTL